MSKLRNWPGLKLIQVLLFLLLPVSYIVGNSISNTIIYNLIIIVNIVHSIMAKKYKVASFLIIILIMVMLINVLGC